MARQRRGGFKPPELRGTLGTLLRTTIQQAGVVRDAARDVLERGVREGRARLDDAQTTRRRTDALAELGEIVLDLMRRGEIDPTELPEVHDIVHVLDEIDDSEGRDVHSHSHSHAHPHDDVDEDRVTIPPSRSRFDDRGAPPPRRPPPTERSRNPANETIPGSSRRRAAAPSVSDGTVSSASQSGRFSSPTRMDPASQSQRVWRPSTPDVPPRDAPTDARTVAPPFRAKAMAPAPRKGGISFDDDEDADLGEYMHPDDVPPKPSDP